MNFSFKNIKDVWEVSNCVCTNPPLLSGSICILCNPSLKILQRTKQTKLDYNSLFRRKQNILEELQLFSSVSVWIRLCNTKTMVSLSDSQVCCSFAIVIWHTSSYFWVCSFIIIVGSNIVLFGIIVLSLSLSVILQLCIQRSDMIELQPANWNSIMVSILI